MIDWAPGGRLERDGERLEADRRAFIQLSGTSLCETIPHAVKCFGL